jgi:hypothetical protein
VSCQFEVVKERTDTYKTLRILEKEKKEKERGNGKRENKKRDPKR